MATDRLTNEERVLAWKATWHPSFDGVAIVNKDFTFRSVNPQFCKLLGVTPADLVGNRFQDITPPGIKELDQKNAQMVIDGLIDFYLLPKRYEFANGNEVDVVLLVTAVRDKETQEFLFFVSRIMLDETEGLLSSQEVAGSELEQSFQTSIFMVAEFLIKHGKWLAALGAIIAGAGAFLFSGVTWNFK